MKIYFEMFWSFLKIGAFTLGGGYAMIPLIQAEVVDKKRWINEEEFLNMLALAQSAPGVLAANTAIFIGYRIRGLRGVCATLLGSILPSFIIILLIAAIFTRFRELPQIEAIFKGIRPAVVALIAAPLYKMAKSAGLIKTKKSNNPNFRKSDLLLSWLLLLIPITVALLIWICNISPIYIILLTIISTISIVYFKHKKGGKV